MADEVQLPETAPYRVRIGAAVYDKAVAAYNDRGEGEVRFVRDYGRRGETIELVPREAARLEALDAVVPADEPLNYDEMDDAQLAAEAKQRGLVVSSSSADPNLPLRTDFINALLTYDQGGAEAVGVSSSSGGLIGNGLPLEADGTPTEQTVGTVPAGAASDSVEALAARIDEEKLTASETVDLAGDDPALAAQVLEAERLAQGGDPRATVEKPLQKIIDGGE
jgi:hypothetical protein